METFSLNKFSGSEWGLIALGLGGTSFIVAQIFKLLKENQVDISRRLQSQIASKEEILHVRTANIFQTPQKQRSSQRQEPQSYVSQPLSELLIFEDPSESRMGRDGPKIFRFCITGGPCGGKTTGLSYLSEKLREEGFEVLIVPEAATMIASGGGMLQMSQYTERQQIEFQVALMRTQINLETTFYRLAKLNQKSTILLCDRGLMDGSAYMKHENWKEMLEEQKIKENHIRDQRYDSVIHMVSAADGAEKAYALNKIRHENLALAKFYDRQIQDAWLGHPNFWVIDNKTVNNFEEKLQKLLQTVRKQIGLTNECKFYQRYLIDAENLNFPKDVKVLKFFIEDTFISYDKTKDHFQKLRKRTQNDIQIYIISGTYFGDKTQTIAFKKLLNYNEYLLMLHQVDSDRHPLLKERRCFVWENFSYIIDSYMNLPEPFSILRVKLEKENQEHMIPPFIKVLRNITTENGYKSDKLAKKNWYIPEEDKKK